LVEKAIDRHPPALPNGTHQATEKSFVSNIEEAIPVQETGESGLDANLSRVLSEFWRLKNKKRAASAA